MKLQHIALFSILFMVGVMINHIAVTKLMLGLDAVWIYDLSLIWVISMFYIALTKDSMEVKKCR